jgi:hypothetical protein
MHIVCLIYSDNMIVNFPSVQLAYLMALFLLNMLMLILNEEQQ